MPVYSRILMSRDTISLAPVIALFTRILSPFPAPHPFQIIT